MLSESKFRDLRSLSGSRLSKTHPLKTFALQACLEYRDKFREKVFRSEVAKPWMKYREIALIEEVILRLRPKRALEWGAGYGTWHFPRLQPDGGEWITVEHDPIWAEKIAAGSVPSHVKVHMVPSSQTVPAHAGKVADGLAEDYGEYVEFPSRYGEFDFILVDGRSREECLAAAFDLLKDGGVVILHDANRDYNPECMAAYPRQVYFRDYRRYAGGVWIGGKDKSIDEVLDLERHRSIWRLYQGIGKALRL